MHRYKKAAIIVVATAVAALMATRYVLRYPDGGPTSEEFRVYDAFLNRLTSDGHLRQGTLVLEGETLSLSDPQYDTWIPTELRSDKTWPNPAFVSFCGRVCAHDFVRKNLAAWQLKPSPEVGTAFRIMRASQALEPRQCAISVTRVGFELRRARAVLSYSESCEGNGGIILGDAYLLRKNGMWTVDNYQSFSF
jgi:hypothetical protein